MTFFSYASTLVALHFTPVSEWVSEWAEFRTSVALRLASLLSLHKHNTAHCINAFCVLYLVFLLHIMVTYFLHV